MLKDNINNLWQNKRARSAIFLLFWVAFIVYLFVAYAIPYEKEKANNTVTNEVLEDNEGNEEIYFSDLKLSLLRYNFNYVYTVTTLDEKIIYKGTMLGNETTGYKESALGIEKYYLNGMQIYKDVLGEKVLQLDKTTNVYNSYLSVDYIMDLIEGKEAIINDNQYDFQIDSVYVKISIANDNIAKIEVIDGNNNYLLEFSNVNEVNELNY